MPHPVLMNENEPLILLAISRIRLFYAALIISLHSSILLFFGTQLMYLWFLMQHQEFDTMTQQLCITP